MPLVVARMRDLRPGHGRSRAISASATLGDPLGTDDGAVALGDLPGPECLRLPRRPGPDDRSHASTRDHRQVSGFTQMVGYLFCGPRGLRGGCPVAEATGGWTVPLVLLALCGPVLAVAGSLASRPHIIDDDLV